MKSLVSSKMNKVEKRLVRAVSFGIIGGDEARRTISVDVRERATGKVVESRAPTVRWNSDPDGGSNRSNEDDMDDRDEEMKQAEKQLKGLKVRKLKERKAMVKRDRRSH